MNSSSQPFLRRLLTHRRPLHHLSTANSHYYYSTTTTLSAMKPGTQIPGLSSIYPPSKDPTAAANNNTAVPTAKPRSEYPSWVSTLSEAPPTLAKLRNMKMEEATDKDLRRYLKLVRRGVIKDNNSIAGI